MSPIIQARLSQLLVTSLYEDSGKGTFLLNEQPNLLTPPWFWPPIAEISCKQKKYPEVYPPWGGGQQQGFPVQPKTPPGRWVDVVDQTEDGKTILVGRIPVWDEFWSGSPPKKLRAEIPHAEVDAFLGGLMQGTVSSVKAFFEEKPEPWQSMLPPKTPFGSGFPIDGGPWRPHIPDWLD